MHEAEHGGVCFRTFPDEWLKRRLGEAFCFCSDDSRAQVVFSFGQWRLRPSSNSANCMKRPSTSPLRLPISPAPILPSEVLALSFKTVAAAVIKPKRRVNYILCLLSLTSNSTSASEEMVMLLRTCLAVYRRQLESQDWIRA